MESDMAAYKNDFLQELYECLDIFNRSFVDLENGDSAAVNEIFRVAHTIKGMAGFLAYKSLEKLCHSMEEVLCGIKNGDIEIDGELIDIMLSTVDRITEMVTKIENEDNDNVKIEDLLDAFDSYKKINNGSGALCIPEPVKNNLLSSGSVPIKSSGDNISSELEPQDEPQTTNICGVEDCNLILSVILSDDCLVKDLRAALIIESLRDICKVIKTNPDEDEMAGDFTGRFLVFISGDSDKIEGLMDRISEIEQFNIISNENPESFNSALVSLLSSKDKPPSGLKIPEDQETKNFSIAEDYNLILNVVLSDDCLAKDLRASLIIESLRDVCNVIKTDPEEYELDRNFVGNLTIFLSGDSGKVEELMDRISEIEQYNIVSEERDKYSSSSSEDFQANVESTPDTASETTAVSTANRSNIFRFSIRNLITKIHFILKINKSFSGLRSIEFAGILPGKKFKNSSSDSLRPQQVPVAESNSENTPDQELLLDKVQVNKLQVPEEKSGDIRRKGFQLQKIKDLDESENDSDNPDSESGKSKTIVSETKRQETIRVSTSNLDNIMNLVGELVINKGRLLQISQKYRIPELEEATGSLDKSISSLQDEVMRTRMVKIERVFSKFPRMVRDLSRKLNKDVEFEIEGQDTELDRTILDEISDPLVHLVRNAVDHGIENAQERKNAEKSETGHIKLSARREKNNVIIEIEDDGKGLDVEVLKKKALDKGILSSFDIENLSDDEVRMLIFVPGFSTKESVTEISGRGVGMDAVKTAVEKLGGKVRIYSKKGEYTKIRIDLPPTVAIIKSLLVEVGSETYAIPISNVVKALSVDKNDYKLVKGTPVLYINDRLIPILELKEIFNIKCEKSDKQIAIIVEKENEEVGLMVDSIIDQQEIVIKQLANIFSSLKGFIGVTILGDGRVIPILDVSMLIRDDIDD